MKNNPFPTFDLKFNYIDERSLHNDDDIKMMIIFNRLMIELYDAKNSQSELFNHYNIAGNRIGLMINSILKTAFFNHNKQTACMVYYDTLAVCDTAKINDYYRSVNNKGNLTDVMISLCNADILNEPALKEINLNKAQAKRFERMLIEYRTLGEKVNLLKPLISGKIEEIANLNINIINKIFYGNLPISCNIEKPDPLNLNIHDVIAAYSELNKRWIYLYLEKGEHADKLRDIAKLYINFNQQ